MGLFSKRHKDPVCGMGVKQGAEAAKEPHGGHTDSFCSAECATKFRANPAQYP